MVRAGSMRGTPPPAPAPDAISVDKCSAQRAGGSLPPRGVGVLDPILIWTPSLGGYGPTAPRPPYFGDASMLPGGGLKIESASRMSRSNAGMVHRGFKAPGISTHPKAASVCPWPQAYAHGRSRMPMAAMPMALGVASGQGRDGTHPSAPHRNQLTARASPRRARRPARRRP